MGVWIGAAWITALLPQAAGEEVPLGPRAVNVRNAAFYQTVRPFRKLLRDAHYGEPVTVTGVVGSFSKVLLNDGAEAYIASSALIPREKFKPEAADEAEMGKIRAQGYEAGRFDPETEKKYKAQKGPALEAAYREVDALEARALVRDRAGLERALVEFRRAGRLGEFGPAGAGVP